MAKYPGRAILVENSDYFQFDLPLNHFFLKKIKLKPVHRLVLVRLFYGKNLKKKKEEKNEALFINPLYSAGHNSHSSKTHCPAATQANLIHQILTVPSLPLLFFPSQLSTMPIANFITQRINFPLHRPTTKKNCKPTPLSSSSLPHHPYRSSPS